MEQYKTKAHIHSLNGEMATVTVLDKPNPNVNNYIVDYNGVKCTAIFNVFVGTFYADDVYGIIENK